MTQHLARRELFRHIGGGTLAALAPAVLLESGASVALADSCCAKPEKSDGAFTLPELPYKHDALQPSIDTQTMQIHHGKHHAGYVRKLNAAIKGHDKLSSHTVEDLLRKIDSVPKDIRQSVINNGGGHANHSLFWSVMAPSPKAQHEPQGELARAIDSTFGSFDKFKENFTKTAAGQFGSGWGWLTVCKQGKLHVVSTPNQDSPLMKGHTPILGVDVWEHAYYLKYQNRRTDYIKAWWKVVDFRAVGSNFDHARKA